MIPMNDFQSEYHSIQSEIDAAIHRVLESGYYVLGTEVENFEKEFASYLGVEHVVGVANGLEALQIGLMALGIGAGDEVITTPLSAVATTLAITNTGATPIFADIDDFFHLNPLEVKRKITKKTKAIIPVHLYGQAADMDELQAICSAYGIVLVEDAAQAHGALYRGKKLGSFGKFGAFSFYPTKNLGTCGDGGAISTNDKDLAQRCSLLRNYGQKHRYEHSMLGLNSRLDEIHAAILRVKLKHIDEWNMRRKKIAQRYTEAFSKNAEIITPKERPRTSPVYHLYVIQLENRDRVMKSLEEKGIMSLIHYPIPIHKQPCYPLYNNESYPTCEKSCDKILSLPINPFLSDHTVEAVIKAVQESV